VGRFASLGASPRTACEPTGSRENWLDPVAKCGEVPWKRDAVLPRSRRVYTRLHRVRTLSRARETKIQAEMRRSAADTSRH
jgi:hypothetical protein